MTIYFKIMIIAYYGQICFDDFTIKGKSSEYLFSGMLCIRLYPNSCIGFLHTLCIFWISSDFIVFFQLKAVGFEFLEVLYLYIQVYPSGSASISWLEERSVFRTDCVCPSKKLSINFWELSLKTLVISPLS